MNKRQQKVLKQIIAEMPVQQYAARETRSITGEDVLLSGLEVPEGTEVDKEKNYVFESPVLHISNHYRRCKRAYDRNGFEGLYNYLKKFVIPEKREEYKLKLQQVWPV